MKDPRKTISVRVKNGRLAIGMTQAELAAKTQLHVTAVSHIESGHRLPEICKLCRVASVLMVSLDYLAGRKDY